MFPDLSCADTGSKTSQRNVSRTKAECGDVVSISSIVVVPCESFPRDPGKRWLVDSKGESTWTSSVKPWITRFTAVDHNVRKFPNKGTSQREVYTQYAAFFTQLLTYLQTIDRDLAKHNVKIDTKDFTAVKFRLLMTQDQTYDAPNEYWKMFYQQVCQKAEDKSNGIYIVSQVTRVSSTSQVHIANDRIRSQNINRRTIYDKTMTREDADQ